ncbi:MAG: TIGR02757 family protein [Chitinophagaceae bacterium]
MDKAKLKDFLDAKVDEYNQPFFIKDDPISIPHSFTKQQDIEIAGFFAATFAWGTRVSIINSCKRLFQLMDNSPYDFICDDRNNSAEKLKPFLRFAHRTFNASDLLSFFNFFRYHYTIKKQQSLETAFTKWMRQGDYNIENALNGFHHYFFNQDIEFEKRTMKHIAAPFKKSACKRLNMFLRWMVRNDKKGVDFGIWKKISASQLICPLDVHVLRVAQRFNLLREKQANWKAAVELTDSLKLFDAKDPVKYDFALFSLGAMEKHG